MKPGMFRSWKEVGSLIVAIVVGLGSWIALTVVVIVVASLLGVWEW